jgi:KDO2-lipid IV(A) lauroyltransferase
MNNLAIAFPEKSLTERESIASEFYKRFVDTFIETIKLLSMSDREFDRRCTGDFGSIKAFAAKGRSIQIMGGHQFNWEFIILTWAGT